MKLSGKAIFCTLVAVCITNANAIQFTVTNSTKNLASVRINGACSREYGVLKVLTSATVDGATLARYCVPTAAHCLAEVFSSTTCQDSLIGYFYINTGKGNTGEGAAVTPYRIVIKPFQVTVSQ